MVNPGDILMDSTSIEDAFLFVCERDTYPRSTGSALLDSLARFTQALVIHSRIVVEPSSYNTFLKKGSLFEYISQFGLGDIIVPLEANKSTLKKFENLAKRKTETLAINIIQELTDVQNKLGKPALLQELLNRGLIHEERKGA
jgi:hypothetical protein